MLDNSTDLWPADFAILSDKPPIAILREQAAALGRRTQNVLEGEVRTDTTPNGSFRHRFFIKSPALDGYRYLLFVVKHEVFPYPVRISSSDFDDDLEGIGEFQPTICHSQAELEAEMRTFLAAEPTKKIVGSLLQMSVA